MSIAENLEIYGTWRIEIHGCVIFRMKRLFYFLFIYLFHFIYLFIVQQAQGWNFLKDILEISSKVV